MRNNQSRLTRFNGCATSGQRKVPPARRGIATIRSTVALLFVATISSGATAAVTTTAVDVPSRGAIQRFLYIHPDAPTANIIALPGGDGMLGIQIDGSETTSTAQCELVGRNRKALTDRGYALAIVDATSTGSVQNFDDVLEVIRYVQQRDNVPIWIFGGSSSTTAVTNLAAGLPADMRVGAIYFSPDHPTPLAASVRRPALVVYNPLDPLQNAGQLFAALTSATVKEQASLTGGNNNGCGFHLFNGIEAAFVSAVGGFIDKYNAATAGTAANYEGLWWKSPAGSESGWGINFAHQGDIIFATWFTYDLSGKAWWLSMTAPRATDGSFAGTLYETHGPAFNAVPFSPAAVTATPVGSGTLTFSDSANGSFAYTVNGVSQTKAITRQVFGTLPTCTFGAQNDLTVASNYQDLWWAAPAGDESGWGVNLTHQDDTIFATWFTYDFDGNPLWLSATTPKTAPGVYAGTLYRTTGPAFNAVPFAPENVALSPVGTLTITFAHGNSAAFAYTVTLPGQAAVAQTKTVTRQVFRAPGTVCQ